MATAERDQAGQRWTEYVPLESLQPDPRNPRLHANIEDLRASLGRFGYAEIITLDERTGLIVAGHGRRELLLDDYAAGREPPEGVRVAENGGWLVPVSRGWRSENDDAAFAYIVASNRLAETGGWQSDLLASGLQHLAGLDDGVGLVGVGYSSADLEALLADLAPEPDPPAVLSDPDDVPKPPADPITKPGDLWLLGDHRLLCGDATEVADLDRVLDGEHLAGTVVTDPPYGVAIGAKNRALDAIDRADRVLTDLEGDRGIEEVETLWREAFGALIKVMAPGCPYYVFGPQGGELGLLLLLLLRESGLAPRHVLIWVKNRPSFSIGRLDYDYQHEPVIYGWKPGGPHPWHADGTRTSVLQFDRPQASPDHPTQKPVDLLRHLIENSTQPGGIVLDPFGGSGSTLIACHLAGRRARLVEIDPHYCDVAVRRWEQMTGEQATRVE